LALKIPTCRQLHYPLLQPSNRTTQLWLSTALPYQPPFSISVNAAHQYPLNTASFHHHTSQIIPHSNIQASGNKIDALKCPHAQAFPLQLEMQRSLEFSSPVSGFLQPRELARTGQYGKGARHGALIRIIAPVSPHHQTIG
jgi:hypothetical protein